MARLLGRLCLATLASILIGSPVSAHHSVGGQFDVSKKITLVGTVDRVDWVNPHIYVHFRVKEESGQEVVWRLGTVPVGMARAAGITKESLLAKGQTLKVTAYPARDGTQKLGFLFRVDYPDGHYVQVSPDRE